MMNRRYVKSIPLALICLCVCQPLLAQSGIVYDSMEMNSEILGGKRKYAVYLPPDFRSSERRYPVLYLLHGSGDDQSGWIQFGEVLRIADEAIRTGKATPMIIVMPNADAGRRGYFNSAAGDWRYEDFFFEEFIPHVESTFRIRSEKRYRAIAGLSMGGGGTFMYALHHPELFSSACPLSASVGPLDVDAAIDRFSKPPRGMQEGEAFVKPTEEQIRSYYPRHSALELVKSLPKKQISSVRWYIDCGDDDFLYEGNSLVHIALRKRQIEHEFRIRDGSHSWTYWRESLPEVLHFVSQAFHQY